VRDPLGHDAGRGVDQDDAERVDVAGGTYLKQVQLLGRHEGLRAHPLPDGREAGRGQHGVGETQGDTEIDHLGAVGCHYHIGWLEVPVHNVTGMHLREGLDEAEGEPPDRSDVKRPRAVTVADRCHEVC
jgi:hypothetical protein